MKREERQVVYEKLEKGDILQFRTCKDLIKASGEMERQGIKYLQAEQINGTKGLFLIVTDRKKMISDYLLEKCRFCKQLEEEKEKLNKELARVQKKGFACSEEINKKTREFLKTGKCLRDVREMIARVLIEELGI